MIFRRNPWLALLLLPIALQAEPALKSGEAFTYRVSWGVFVHAGEIRIAALDMPTPEGEPRLQVVTNTATRGFARALYPFDARAESYYDGKSGRLLVTTEVTKNDAKEAKVTTEFDYAKSTASYRSSKNSAPAMLIMPEGEPQDLIMSLVQTRRWTLKPGQHQDALVIFGDEFYQLTIYAERYEEVRTSLGTFNTLVLVPKMEKTPPKGMFKRGGAVRVWISQDDRRLPVKFQVDFKFGAGVATLSAYLPPQKETAKPAAPATANAKDPRP